MNNKKINKKKKFCCRDEQEKPRTTGPSILALLRLSKPCGEESIL
jgi:hypothetical protein